MARVGGNPNLPKIDSARAKELNKLSVESRKRKIELKEELLMLLSKGDTTERMSLSLIQKAIDGDVKAFEVIRDTIGQKPVERQEIKQVDTDWYIETTEEEKEE